MGASVGRKRKDDSLGLPLRVYVRRGTFFYAHPGGGWENLGKDLDQLKTRLAPRMREWLIDG